MRDVAVKEAVFIHGAIGSSAGINIDGSTAYVSVKFVRLNPYVYFLARALH